MIFQKEEGLFVGQVVTAIQGVVGKQPAALHEPTFEGNEWEYLKDCLDSTYVSSVGKYVDQFERDLSEYTGSNYAISVVNGTSALHISLKIAGVVQNDEVLIPALTFVATANAVVYCGAIPHFVDSEESTLGIDPIKLEEYLQEIAFLQSGLCINKSTGRVIRAIVVMHALGHPSNLEGLINLASKFNMKLIEDSAESIGSLYKGAHTGTFGLLGILSFNGNKTITTGGGGAILTNDRDLARRAKHLTTTAKIPHAWEFDHDEIAFNYRMPNINAALGCGQLEQLPSKLAAKRKLYELYSEAFKTVEGLTLVTEPKDSISNYWLQAFLLKPDYSKFRDEILLATNNLSISTRPAWKLLNTLNQFSRYPTMDTETSESMFSRLICMPSSPKIATSFLKGN